MNALKIDKDSKIKKLTLNKSVVNDRFEIIEKKDFEYLDLTGSTFKDFVDFASTTFKNNVSFENTTFEAGAAFVKCKFNGETDFTYTSFEDKSFFNEAEFSKKIDLETATFYKNVDFLKITTEVANRETARKIKDSFEKQNNIIEANKFYALEMKEREKELTKDMKEGKNIFEWLIFKAHAISSNHSQDWHLALFWIIVIGTIYTIVSFCSTNTCLNSINTPILIGSIFLISLYNLHVYNKNDYRQFTKYIFLFLLFVNYFALTKDVTLSCLADKIYPTSKDPITFWLLLFKVTIAYLIYQFIVSVRQNTRRK